MDTCLELFIFTKENVDEALEVSLIMEESVARCQTTCSELLTSKKVVALYDENWDQVELSQSEEDSCESMIAHPAYEKVT